MRPSCPSCDGSSGPRQGGRPSFNRPLPGGVLPVHVLRRCAKAVAPGSGPGRGYRPVTWPPPTVPGPDSPGGDEAGAFLAAPKRASSQGPPPRLPVAWTMRSPTVYQLAFGLSPGPVVPGPASRGTRFPATTAPPFSPFAPIPPWRGTAHPAVVSSPRGRWPRPFSWPVHSVPVGLRALLQGRSFSGHYGPAPLLPVCADPTLARDHAPCRGQFHGCLQRTLVPPRVRPPAVGREMDDAFPPTRDSSSMSLGPRAHPC